MNLLRSKQSAKPFFKHSHSAKLARKRMLRGAGHAFKVVRPYAQERDAFRVFSESPEGESSFERSPQARIDIGVYPLSGRVGTFCIGK